MKTILFYGDSNTWGYNSLTDRRYPFEVRFTGILSERLKDQALEMRELILAWTTLWRRGETVTKLCR